METTTAHYAHTAVESLTGKRILITGGTTGIGRAIAVLLGSYGAHIITFGRQQQALDEALDAIRAAGGQADGLIADSSKADDIKRLFAFADEKLGGLDVLVNNAALGAESLSEMSDTDWRYVIETNLIGYMATAKEALNRMQPQKHGHIVLIGSMSADVREAGSSVYVATKSAIQGFAESLRKEVNPDGIKVSLVEPGAVGSDMQDTTSDEERDKQASGEMLRAEDIAVAVHYILTQPRRCDVVSIQIRPHLQLI
ncbi:short-chain dehydrogenase/reductase SDR [Fibrella aestuarina BUZ 2]|uniref:Short-chain dehydrogenase/reductase SDR n=1 Tax=Fibrella aestuarina BUZ 2 TaxID=1166018 RepID=I0KF20_9BACT|nr:SDR family oxidoreductase [Fibrella aestuarina]CCH02723.1 short-chain dehydrogenase/reductase SDR [Fibrella aestuarina BUZ 2]